MIRSLPIIAILALCACQPASLSTPSSVQLCEQTVRDYAVLRDEGPADQYADLFTDDGKFYLGPQVVTGRDALIARYVNANAISRFRHNVDDIRISDFDGKITGLTRVTIYVGPKTESASSYTRTLVGDYIDEFLIEGGRCKIKSRKVEVLFDTDG